MRDGSRESGVLSRESGVLSLEAGVWLGLSEGPGFGVCKSVDRNDPENWMARSCGAQS